MQKAEDKKRFEEELAKAQTEIQEQTSKMSVGNFTIISDSCFP